MADLRPLQFGFPPAIGQSATDQRLTQFADFLAAQLGNRPRVAFSTSYEDLARKMQLGALDVAWAPPFVAARLEALGFKVLLRGLRKGASTYRSALVVPNASNLTLETLKRTRAAWVDPDSVSGYLLPLAFLKSRGLNPAKDLASQEFAGSFVAAVERVIYAQADFAAVFAPPEGVQWKGKTGLDEMAPHLAARVKILGFTDPVPNAGLVAAVRADPKLLVQVTQALKKLGTSPDGPWLMEQLFQTDGFEEAPQMGYRALYKVAVASL